MIEGAFGLGESVVSGSVSPDRYVVDKATLARSSTRDVKRKELVIEPPPGGGTVTRALAGDEATAPVLTDDEVPQLAELGVRDRGPLRRAAGHRVGVRRRRRRLDAAVAAGDRSAGDERAERAERGASRWCAAWARRPGSRERRGAASSATLADAAELSAGDVLVTHMTAPDWVPLMRRAAAIVTDSGGMTCHAAIVSRELGIPCVVGTGDATTKLRDGELVTVDADARRGARGRGRRPAAAAPAAAAGGRRGGAGDRRRGCWSTSPSPRRSSAPPRSTSTASGCCAPS